MPPHAPKSDGRFQSTMDKRGGGSKIFTSTFIVIIFFSFLQSIIIVVFREERSVEEELQAWEFWHSRQHSVKQRILDIGTLQFCNIY